MALGDVSIIQNAGKYRARNIRPLKPLYGRIDRFYVMQIDCGSRFSSQYFLNDAVWWTRQTPVPDSPHQSTELPLFSVGSRDSKLGVMIAWQIADAMRDVLVAPDESDPAYNMRMLSLQDVDPVEAKQLSTTVQGEAKATPCIPAVIATRVDSRRLASIFHRAADRACSASLPGLWGSSDIRWG